MKNTIFIYLIALIFVFLLGNKLLQNWNNTTQKTNLKASVSNGSSEEQAKKLLSQMTLAEKIQLVHGQQEGKIYVGQTQAIPRLGIPPITLQDGKLYLKFLGPQGVGGGLRNVTVWPSSLAISATWDRKMMYKFAKSIGEEQKGKGVMVHLGPCINMARVPRNGRAFEAMGEDPFLTAQMAYAYVQGIQSNKILACAKHWINNDQERDRDRYSAIVDERTEKEFYLPPFHASIEAGVGTFMCSYNKKDGVYACENEETLKKILRDDLGFKGWVMSDWWATHSTVNAANNGLDQEMPFSDYFGKLEDAIK